MKFTLLDGTEIRNLCMAELLEYFGLDIKDLGNGSIRLTNVHAPCHVRIPLPDTDEECSPADLPHDAATLPNGNGEHRLPVSVSTIIEDGQLLVCGNHLLRFHYEANGSGSEPGSLQAPTTARHRFRISRQRRRLRH